MKIFPKYVAVSLYLLFNSIASNATIFPVNIDQIARGIFSEIIKLESVPANLNIAESAAHTSTPDGRITLSRSELNKLYSTSSPENFTIFLSIIIAHEYAHQIQFADHKSEMLQTSSCELKTFYEAEADIIAGYLFCRLNKYYETENILSTNSDGIKSALGFIYNLGDAEYSLGTHPSFKQRRNSFRMGIAFGIYKYCSDVNIKNKVGSAYYIKESSDWDIWYEKMAKAVCHSPNIAISNILVEDVGEVQWNKTQNNPTVTFAQKFTNLSQEEIHLFIQYKVMGANRTDPDPSYTDITGDIKYFEFNLPPLGSYTCSGTLNWKTVASTTYMPRLVTPPDNECIYFGTSVSGKNEYDDKCLGNKIDFSGAISKINRESLDNFQLLIFGFKASVTEEFISHQSKFIFPQSESNEISVYKEDSSYNYDIGFAGSEAKMMNIYASLKKCLIDLSTDNLKLKDDFSFYFNEDGTRTKYDKNYNITVQNQFELIKKNDRVESYSVKGVFGDTGCKVEIELVKNLKYSEYQVSLSFIKSSK